jgi:carbamoyltransferase
VVMRATSTVPVRRPQAKRTRDGLSGFAPRLREAGYTSEALQQLLRLTVPDDIGALNHTPALERAASVRSTAATLTRLFFLEADESVRTVHAALSRRVCEELVATGILQRRGDRLRARVRIDAVGDQYFMTDRRFRTVDRHALRLPAGDAVYPPSSDSLMLRDAIGAAATGQVLDLCTGSGIQALQVARKAERVIAVDLNPRATAIARRNAQLNGITNVDVRVGDLYAPVRGEPFDLVLANPPFVASPYDTAPSYHSGGPTGDRVLRRIIAGLGTHLRPGGRAFAISHLALRTGEDLQAVANRWFRRFPGRALVLLLETGTPIDLAAAQSLFALDRGLTAYAAEVRRWVQYLRRHRVSTIAVLLIVAECGEHRSVEVVEAQPRVLPIPLTRPPAERIALWLAS